MVFEGLECLTHRCNLRCLVRLSETQDGFPSIPFHMPYSQPRIMAQSRRPDPAAPRLARPVQPTITKRRKCIEKTRRPFSNVSPSSLCFCPEIDILVLTESDGRHGTVAAQCFPGKMQFPQMAESKLHGDRTALKAMSC